MFRPIAVLLIFSLYATPGLLASDFVHVKTTDDQELKGELVHRYEAKWFWEEQGESWLALLPSEADLSGLVFLPNSQVAYSSSFQGEAPGFLSKMKSAALFLSRLPFNGSNFVSTGNDGHHLHENMYGDFAWDFEKRVDGKAYKGNPSKQEDYFTWGERVYSPVSGEIVDLFDDAPDNSVDPTLSSSLEGVGDGNFVLIKISDLYFVSLLHFKKASLAKGLHIGSSVEVGDYLGEVGNSGRSYLPHLHMTTYFYSPFWRRMFSVPNRFKSLVERDGTTSRPRQEVSPKTGRTYRDVLSD